MYFGRVIPGEYGVADPWYFPCIPLWRRFSRISGYKFSQEDSPHLSLNPDGNMYEEVTEELKKKGPSIFTSQLKKGAFPSFTLAASG